MYRSCPEIKRLSRGNLTGNYHLPMIASVTLLSLVFFAQIPFRSLLLSNSPGPIQNLLFFIAVFFVYVFAAPLSFGVKKIHFTLSSKETGTYLSLFDCYRHHPDRYILTFLILSGFYLVASIPLIIGIVTFLYVPTAIGIVILSITSIISLLGYLWIHLTFSMIYFLLIDQQDLAPIQGIKECFHLMKKHKLRYLYLHLSFIGWWFLNLFTLGLGMLWIIPYYLQCTTVFYLDLSKDKVMAQ